MSYRLRIGHKTCWLLNQCLTIFVFLLHVEAAHVTFNFEHSLFDNLWTHFSFQMSSYFLRHISSIKVNFSSKLVGLWQHYNHSKEKTKSENFRENNSRCFPDVDRVCLYFKKSLSGCIFGKGLWHMENFCAKCIVITNLSFVVYYICMTNKSPL